MAASILAGTAPILVPSDTALWAYLDPGAGSMLFQIAMAGLLSSMFFAKNSLQMVRGWFSAKKTKA